MNQIKKAKRKDGKRWDKDYQQLTAYVLKETHMAVRLSLMPEKREVSELVQELLTAWLAGRSASSPSAVEQRREAAVQQAVLAAEREFSSDEFLAEERLALTARFLMELAKKLIDKIEANPRHPQPNRESGNVTMEGQASLDKPAYSGRSAERSSPYGRKSSKS
jgi:hypothetical protein